MYGRERKTNFHHTGASLLGSTGTLATNPFGHYLDNDEFLNNKSKTDYNKYSFHDHEM